MFKTIVAALLLTAACAQSEPPAPPWTKQTIPAFHCGILESEDGGPILIGTNPDELAPGGTHAEFIISDWDFVFYTENATLTLYSTEYCWSH